MDNTTKNFTELSNQIIDLKQQALDLQHHVYRLQLEKDALEKATELKPVQLSTQIVVHIIDGQAG